MFEKLRKPGSIKNIFSYFVFGSICIIFIFIGVPVSQMSNMGGVALIVNNKVISLGEYSAQLDMLKQQSKGADDADNNMAKRQKRQVIDNLIHTELITQKSDSIDFIIAQKEVQDHIVKIPLFKKQDRFVYSRYHAFLKSRRFSASYFEDLIRKEIRTKKFQNLFNLTVSTSQQQKQKQKQLDSTFVEMSYIQFASQKINAEQLKVIKKSLQTGDIKSVLKSYKLKWKNIKSFNLNRVSLPDLESSEILLDTIINQLPKIGIIKYIVNVRDQSFILRVNNFKQNIKKSEIKNLFFMDKMASTITFFSWMRLARDSAELKFNPILTN